MSDLDAAQRLFRARAAMRDRDVNYLLRAINDPDNRSIVAKMLGELGDPRAIKPLQRMLRAEDPHARAAAARALGDLGANTAVEELVHLATSDPELFVREWAIDALARSQCEDVFVVLEKLLSDSEWRVRRSASRGLVELRNARGIRALREAAGAERRYARRRWHRASLQELQRLLS